LLLVVADDSVDKAIRDVVKLRLVVVMARVILCNMDMVNYTKGLE
jgi:hypothetical protein